MIHHGICLILAVTHETVIANTAAAALLLAQMCFSDNIDCVLSCKLNTIQYLCYSQF